MTGNNHMKRISVTIYIFVFAVNESDIMYLVSQISFCSSVLVNKKHVN